MRAEKRQQTWLQVEVRLVTEDKRNPLTILHLAISCRCSRGNVPRIRTYAGTFHSSRLAPALWAKCDSFLFV